VAVAGVGVDHETLTELFGKMQIREGPKPAVMQKAKYHGGGIFSAVFHSLAFNIYILD